jgi:hypothetical protein
MFVTGGPAVRDGGGIPKRMSTISRSPSPLRIISIDQIEQ